MFDKAVVRRMWAEDIDTVLAVENQAYEFPWNRNMFEDCLREDYNPVILESEGLLLGYVIVFSVLQEGHILNFCIAPKFQGKGYGLFLLRKVLEQLKDMGVAEFFIEVRKSNQSAIFLYEKEGFREVGLRKDYYRTRDAQREDALILSYAV